MNNTSYLLKSKISVLPEVNIRLLDLQLLYVDKTAFSKSLASILVLNNFLFSSTESGPKFPCLLDTSTEVPILNKRSSGKHKKYT